MNQPGLPPLGWTKGTGALQSTSGSGLQSQLPAYVILPIAASQPLGLNPYESNLQ